MEVCRTGPEQYAKVFSANCCGHAYIVIGSLPDWAGAIRKSFLCKLLWPRLHSNWKSAGLGRKVFSAKCCGHAYIVIGSLPDWAGAIRKSFLCKLLWPRLHSNWKSAGLDRKVFSAKCCGHAYIVIGSLPDWAGAIRERFLCKLLWPRLHSNWKSAGLGRSNTQKFSPQNSRFCTEMRKFSPSKTFRYMVETTRIKHFEHFHNDL